MGRVAMLCALALALGACSNTKIEQEVSNQSSSENSINGINKTLVDSFFSEGMPFGKCVLTNGDCQNYIGKSDTTDLPWNHIDSIYQLHCTSVGGTYDYKDPSCPGTTSATLILSEIDECYTFKKDLEASMDVLTVHVSYVDTYLDMTYPEVSDQDALSEQRKTSEFRSYVSGKCQDLGGANILQVYGSSLN